MRKHFSICENCIDYLDAEELQTSTSDFEMCAICGTYTRCSDTSAIFEVQKKFAEPCDCEPGRPQHNDGGNYHHTFYKPIRFVEYA